MRVEVDCDETIGLVRRGFQEPAIVPVNMALAAPMLLDCCKKLLIAVDGMYNHDDWLQIKDEVIAMNAAVKVASR